MHWEQGRHLWPRLYFELFDERKEEIVVRRDEGDTVLVKEAYWLKLVRCSRPIRIPLQKCRAMGKKMVRVQHHQLKLDLAEIVNRCDGTFVKKCKGSMRLAWKGLHSKTPVLSMTSCQAIGKSSSRIPLYFPRIQGTQLGQTFRTRQMLCGDIHCQ